MGSGVVKFPIYRQLSHWPHVTRFSLGVNGSCVIARVQVRGRSTQGDTVIVAETEAKLPV